MPFLSPFLVGRFGSPTKTRKKQSGTLVLTSKTGGPRQAAFWGRSTTHLVHFSGDWDVHWGYDLAFGPWPHVSLAKGPHEGAAAGTSPRARPAFACLPPRPAPSMRPAFSFLVQGSVFFEVGRLLKGSLIFFQQVVFFFVLVQKVAKRDISSPGTAEPRTKSSRVAYFYFRHLGSESACLRGSMKRIHGRACRLDHGRTSPQM